MLPSSTNSSKCCFIHLKGINEELEFQLHSMQIHSYDDLANFIAQELDIGPTLPLKFKEYNLIQIEETKRAIDNKNWEYFSKKLLSREQYKLLPFSQNIAYVDIETTGLSKQFHYITTIGIYDGKESKVFVRGIDLEKAYDYLEQFDAIVTFNGKQFDLPFIQHFANRTYNFIHLDLRYLLKELGLSGGLKRIEKQLGLMRDETVKDIDGFEAIRLWKRYERGDHEALELLKKYNIEDIENLEILLNWCLEQKNR